MKNNFLKLALAVLTVGVLGSCSKINERLDNLDKRVDGIENEKIATITGQIDGIKNSIADLGQIRSDISNLKQSAENHGQDIFDLQEADETLGNRIDNLEDYLETVLPNYAEKEWVKATFSTLEQYDSTCTAIAEINAKIGELDTKLSEDIKTCADSLTRWINVKFAGYYTAAEMDAKLAQMKASVDSAKVSGKITDTKADSVAAELTKTKTAVDTAKSHIRSEYKAAIKTAIETSEGKLTKALNDAITKVNDKVNALTGRVDRLAADVQALNGRVSNLEQRIQSVEIVPAFSDGSVLLKNDTLHIDCIVSPATAVSNLKKNHFTVLLNRVKTKAVSLDSVKIAGDKDFCVDSTTGTVSLKVKISEYIPSTQDSALTVAVNVNDGKVSDYTTDFTGVSPFTWESYEQALAALKDSVYSYLNPRNGSWSFRQQLFLGSTTTGDMVSSGADKIWRKDGWNNTNPEIVAFYRNSYKAIENATRFLNTLELSVNRMSEDQYKKLRGEVRALRGFYYYQLAETFGKIKIIDKFTSDAKVREQLKENYSYEQIWDYIIEDFNEANTCLSWSAADDSSDRCTKGMALAYLGESFMWKAYRVPSSENDCYAKAKQCFKEVIASSTYNLNYSYSTLWDNIEHTPGQVGWNKETIWQSTVPADVMKLRSCNVTENDPAMNLTWELFSCFEAGDKRMQASMCEAKFDNNFIDSVLSVQTGASGPLKIPASSQWVVSNRGKNPICNLEINYGPNKFYYQDGDDFLPALWSLKYWRARKSQEAPLTIYWMRYANVLLDYAECCFKVEGGDSNEGWGCLDQIRNRAWGNLEIGQDGPLTDYMEQNGVTAYPIPFNSSIEFVPSAKDYYTYEKNQKGYGKENWEVAVYLERRKEFNGEPCLRGVLQRSGMLDTHINKNYMTGSNQTAARTAADLDEDVDAWVHQGDFTYKADYWKVDGCVPLPELTYPF